MENKFIWHLNSRTGVTREDSHKKIYTEKYWRDLFWNSADIAVIVLAETEEQARQAVADYEPLEARKEGWLNSELSYCEKIDVFGNGLISYSEEG